MKRSPQTSSSASAAGTAKTLLVAVAAETAITIGHFAHGAHTYADPSRLHVVVPALVALALVAALTALFLARPGRPTLVALGVSVAVPFVAVFGVFHGAYSHLAKDVAYLHGASAETLERVFMTPDYAYPNDLVFEVSGVLTLVAAVVVAFLLARLIAQAWPHKGRPGDDGRVLPVSESDAPATDTAPPGGPARLVGLAMSMVFDAPLKSLGTLIGVTVSTFLMAQQLAMLDGILGRVTSFVNSSGVDVWITSLATESTDATDTVPASRVGAAAGTPGVAWAAPVVQGVGRVTRPDGVREYVKVLGVEPPRYAGLPRSLAPGTTPASLRGSGKILLNWNDRPTFAAAEPGDRIEIDGKAGVVAGFFQGMDPHSPYYYVYANIDDARSLTEFPQDRVTYVAVGTAPGANVADVKARLQARIPDVLVKTRAEMSAMEERYFLVRTPVGVLFGLGTIVAAVIGAAIVAVTLYSTAVDRSRDYGTIKAIGARQRDILQLLLVQAWIFFAVGYVLGMIAFFIVRAHLPQLSMAAPPTMVGGVAAATFAACTLASLAAIRRVLRVDPAIVFRA